MSAPMTTAGTVAAALAGATAAVRRAPSPGEPAPFRPGGRAVARIVAPCSLLMS